MDSYVDLFQKNGGSMITLAKGNRSKQVTDACKNNGGFYLGSIGGPAAILGVPDAHMSLHFIVRLLWLMLMPLTMPTLCYTAEVPAPAGQARARSDTAARTAPCTHAHAAKKCIKKVDVLEYPELGMEAIWKIEVEDFPAFIVCDDKGNDFFKEFNM